MINSHPIERDEIMAYLDGELSAERSGVAAAHLETCAECQELETELRGVSETLKNWHLESLSTPDSRLQIALEEWSAKPVEAPRLITPWGNRMRAFRRLFSWRLVPVLLGSTLLVGALVATRLIGNNADKAYLYQQYREALPPQSSTSVLDDSQMRQQDTSAFLTRTIPSAAKGAKDRDRLEQYAKLNRPPDLHKKNSTDSVTVPNPTGPMIIRTAGVAIITKNFEEATARIQEIVHQHHSFMGQLNVNGATGTPRSVQATLRIPANELDAALNEIKKLGRVQSESQNGQEVTSQYIDLQARLANSRNTEQRLIDLLRERTGKLSDVLEVETELARVRGEIEQMEAERKNMLNQVTFATLNATITEDYQAQLQVVPPSTSTRLVNAAVEGYRGMVDGLLSVTLFLLSSVPSLLAWTAILFFPARFAWRKFRRTTA